MANRPVPWLFDLGFYPNAEQTSVRTALGEKKLGRKRILRGLLSWLVLGLGIFVRQGLEFPPIKWNIANFTLGTFLGALVIALAVFRPAMKWLNDRRPFPSFEHIATPFGIGFFLDLAALAGEKVIVHFAG